MTLGFGMSIGTVNSVWAATAGECDLPAVRVRRTAVTFDGAGNARIGGLPRFAPVVTDFADLTREIEPVVVGGRIWTSADLVAAVATCLIAAAEPEGEPVITYPACYPDAKVSALRHALDWAGATATLLMPEPVAAVEWLDAEYGVSDSGLTLVYDLGGNCLDIAVVRTEADRDTRGVLGKPVRSYEYGGRPLGTTLARYARALSPGAPTPVSKIVPPDDTTRLRTWNIRNSLRLVRRCVRAAGLTIGDVDRILLVGGAARPVEVAQVIAELGRPVVMSPDPAHTAAAGAALASARMADTGGNLGRYARGAAVLSSAAVASALAMSAATMLGGGPIGTDGPVLEFAPALAGPAHDAQVFDTPAAGDSGSPVAADAAWRPYSRVQAYSSVAQSLSDSEVERTLSEYGPGTHCAPQGRLRPPIYSDPAQFVNPLPFATNGAVIPTISLPRPTKSSGNGATQPVPGHGGRPGAWDPPTRFSPPPISKVALTNPVPTLPGSGTAPPFIGPRVWTGPSSLNSAGGSQNSIPGADPGTNAQPGSHGPGTVPGMPPGLPGGTVNTHSGGTPSADGNTAATAPGGDHTPNSPGDATVDAGNTAPSPNSGNAPSHSPGSVVPHTMSNSLGGAAADGTPNSGDSEAAHHADHSADGLSNSPGNGTPHTSSDNSLGGAPAHDSLGDTAPHNSLGNAAPHNPLGDAVPHNSLGDAAPHNSLGGAVPHSSPDGITPHSSLGGSTAHSLGGTTSNGTANSPGAVTANSAGGATSHNSLGGATSNGTGGHSFGGGFHGGSAGGGFHGGAAGGGFHGGGGGHG